MTLKKINQIQVCEFGYFHNKARQDANKVDHRKNRINHPDFLLRNAGNAGPRYEVIVQLSGNSDYELKYILTCA